MPQTSPDDEPRPLNDAGAPPTTDAAGEDEPAEPIVEEIAVASEQQVRVRRTPRYGRFMLLGAAVFAVAAFIATYSFPQQQGYDRNEVFGFVLLIALAVGTALGALAALLANLATRRTERTVAADRIDVRVVDASAAPEEDDPPRE